MPLFIAIAWLVKRLGEMQGSGERLWRAILIQSADRLQVCLSVSIHATWIQPVSHRALSWQGAICESQTRKASAKNEGTSHGCQSAALSGVH
jgi:hypothetical protein